MTESLYCQVVFVEVVVNIEVAYDRQEADL